MQFRGILHGFLHSISLGRENPRVFRIYSYRCGPCDTVCLRLTVSFVVISWITHIRSAAHDDAWRTVSYFRGLTERPNTLNPQRLKCLPFIDSPARSQSLPAHVHYLGCRRHMARIYHAECSSVTFNSSILPFFAQLSLCIFHHTADIPVCSGGVAMLQNVYSIVLHPFFSVIFCTYFLATCPEL